jgi:CubicO group peptidase (beta-lactamase class C family)
VGASALLLRSASSASAAFDFGAIRPQIDEKVSAYMQANSVPGVAIGVAYRDGGGPLLEEYFHYGVASTATNAAMDESSIVLINSITKAFTGSLLALNVQRGAMKLDDPLQKHLSDVQVPTFNGQAITLEHLAVHRSGLPRDIPGQTNDKTGDGLTKFLGSYELKVAPGEKYEYSNYAFALLGLVLTRSMGGSFEELVAREFGQPLGMPDTRLTLAGAQNGRLAVTYSPQGAPVPLRPLSSFAPAGDLLSTTPDLMKFLIAHMDPAASPIGGVADAMKKHRDIQGNRGSGLGWEVNSGGTANEAIWKNGGSPGATSEMWFSRGLNFGYVTLTNRGLAVQNGLPAGPSPADQIGIELRRILTAASRG